MNAHSLFFHKYLYLLFNRDISFVSSQSYCLSESTKCGLSIFTCALTVFLPQNRHAIRVVKIQIHPVTCAYGFPSLLMAINVSEPALFILRCATPIDCTWRRAIIKEKFINY